jgi:hypothetical protein
MRGKSTQAVEKGVEEVMESVPKSAFAKPNPK